MATFGPVAAAAVVALAAAVVATLAAVVELAAVVALVTAVVAAEAAVVELGAVVAAGAVVAVLSPQAARKAASKVVPAIAKADCLRNLRRPKRLERKLFFELS